jgi:hypothetical protein
MFWCLWFHCWQYIDALAELSLAPVMMVIHKMLSDVNALLMLRDKSQRTPSTLVE